MARRAALNRSSPRTLSTSPRSSTTGLQCSGPDQSVQKAPRAVIGSWQENGPCGGAETVRPEPSLTCSGTAATAARRSRRRQRGLGDVVHAPSAVLVSAPKQAFSSNISAALPILRNPSGEPEGSITRLPCMSRSKAFGRLPEKNTLAGAGLGEFVRLALRGRCGERRERLLNAQA
ncbi:hypothetical protein D3C86_1117990 [compost metagenome]